jgi:NAD(P)-dependent dehydrogenase (short-subunit alcohol dehydrogenase family)
VNNAGVSGARRLEDTTAEEWDRVMDISARGVFLGTRPPSRRCARAAAAIINICPGWVWSGGRQQPPVPGIQERRAA